MFCLSGVSRVQQDILDQNPSPRLRAYVVWVPKKGAFERDVADATARARDPRVRHFWDGKKAVMTGLRAPLGIHEDPWDVHLVYGPGARWTGDAAHPPKPDYWMQSIGVAEAPVFDPGTFAEEVLGRVRRLL